MTSIVSHQNVRLRRGKHASPEKGVCVMAVSYTHLTLPTILRV